MGQNSTTLEIDFSHPFPIPYTSQKNISIISMGQKFPLKKACHTCSWNVLPGVFSWRRWSNCKRWLEQISIWCTRTTRRPTDYKTSCHLLIYVGFQWSLKYYRLTPSWGRFPWNSNYFFVICCFNRNLAMNITIHVEFCWRRMFFHSPNLESRNPSWRCTKSWPDSR